MVVGFILDALESVFFGAPLAHLEEPGAPVGGKRQLVQHDVFRHAHFLPKIHLHIWEQGKKQRLNNLGAFGRIAPINQTSLNKNIHRRLKKVPLIGLLMWRFCQHDKWGIIHRLLPDAGFVGCSSCCMLIIEMSRDAWFDRMSFSCQSPSDPAYFELHSCSHPEIACSKGDKEMFFPLSL